MKSNDIYTLYAFIFENVVKEKLKTAFSRTEVEALGFYAPKEHYEQLCRQKILRHVIVLGKPIEDIYSFVPEFYCEVMRCRLKRKSELQIENEIWRANVAFKIFITVVVGLMLIRVFLN